MLHTPTDTASCGLPRWHVQSVLARALSVLAAVALFGCDTRKAGGARAPGYPANDASAVRQSAALRAHDGRAHDGRAHDDRAHDGGEDMSELSLSVRRFGPEHSDAPVVVLLHGFGAPGDDLVPLAHALGAPDAYRFVVPEAPHALPEGGRAWWQIDFASRQEQLARGEGFDLRREQPPELPRARAHVEALLDQITARYGVSRARIALVGFSQGAMLSLDTLLHTHEPVGCVGLLSGTFLAAQDWTPCMAERRAVPLFMSHGRQDPLLPFQLSVELRDTLREHGFRVTWQEFAGGHEIPPQVLRALSGFLRECFARS